jgi:hypothetical protein
MLSLKFEVIFPSHIAKIGDAPWNEISSSIGSPL